MNLPIAREGFWIIGALCLAAVVVPLAPGLAWTRWPLLVLAVFAATFFRDPEREPPAGDDLVLCPADGEIVKIEAVEEPAYLGGPSTMVSIFMSPLNCHINRAPISGRVTYLKYNPGTFKMAFRDKASELNEQNSIGFQNARTRLLVRQIAGFIARRIVCRLKLADDVARGQRFGLIQFGSRVDVFLAPDVDVHVRMHEHVKGGLSVLGVLR
jgi:phosphatidylserine decarboxylase